MTMVIIYQSRSDNLFSIINNQHESEIAVLC
jgi:hypothetical protein